MRPSPHLLALLAFLALPLSACGSADDLAPEAVGTAPEAVGTAPEAVGTAPEAVGTAPEAGADLVRDVSAEDGRTGEPAFDCREIDGAEVCDTFGESDEGPGTYDDRDEGPGTTG